LGLGLGLGSELGLTLTLTLTKATLDERAAEGSSLAPGVLR